MGIMEILNYVFPLKLSCSCMTADSLPCHNKDGRTAFHLLLFVLNIRTHIKTIDLSGRQNRVKCQQLIDTFFSFISESPLAFPYLECLRLGFCRLEDRKEVVLYVKEQFTKVRELGGLRRLRSLEFFDDNILNEGV